MDAGEAQIRPIFEFPALLNRAGIGTCTRRRAKVSSHLLADSAPAPPDSFTGQLIGVALKVNTA